VRARSMDFVAQFVLSVLGVAEGQGHRPAKMRMVVRRPYAYLESRLRREFEGRDDVEIISDRRRGERRAGARLVPQERRQSERRARPGQMFEIVIEGDPLTMFVPPH
jgi:hypothetical protein